MNGDTVYARRRDGAARCRRRPTSMSNPLATAARWLVAVIVAVAVLVPSVSGCGRASLEDNPYLDAGLADGGACDATTCPSGCCDAAGAGVAVPAGQPP